MIVVSAISSAAGVCAQRNSVKRDLLPRKQRLEARLQELDAP